jgi:hypothetical protein
VVGGHERERERERERVAEVQTRTKDELLNNSRMRVLLQDYLYVSSVQRY